MAVAVLWYVGDVVWCGSVDTDLIIVFKEENGGLELGVFALNNCCVRT